MRSFLRSKIHRATVTHADVDYEGSITIDRHLMNAADLLPYERVEIYNVTNGERFATYVIEGAEGSGTIGVNGAAAHLASPGDKVIIACYAWLHEGQMLNHQPKLVFVDEANRIHTVKQAEKPQTIAV
ncbi:MAG: aspartate 1-decarboxylase [Acidobacteria bacterium]|nr:aspartate 1-decarboxylase [Acidobacteriota bacterium]